MRIARLMYFTQGYLRFRYGREPSLATLDYEEQRRGLFSDFYSFSDSWERSLTKGGVEARDFPFGVPPLDAAYMRHHGDDAGADSPMAAAIHALKAYQPDVIFISSIEAWSAQAIQLLRHELPSVRGILGMAGVDVLNLPATREVDAFLTCMKGQAASLSEQGMDACFMPHAFDERVLAQVADTERSVPFAFFGNIFTGAQWHDVRRRVLETLVARHDLQLHTEEQSPQSSLARRTAMTAAYWAARGMKHWPPLFSVVPFGQQLRRAASWPGAPSWTLERLLEERRKPAVYGLDMYRALARTMLTVNVHIGAAGPYAANMRLFEATGVGACLLTDSKSDLGEFFEPDHEVVAFSSVEEAAEKAGYLLDHPKVALEIGAAGQRRTLRDHTYDRRAQTVIEAARRAIENGPFRRSHGPVVRQGSARPNLFVVGAMKAGTSSVHAYLRNAPDVFASSVKETHHFSADLHRHPHALMLKTIHNLENVQYIASPAEYQELFSEASPSRRYIADCSTSYLYSKEAAERIFAYNPEAKIVILLRDPAARAWSEYRMNQAIGVETASFERAVAREEAELDAGRTFLFKRYLLAGMYGEQVSRYLSLFPKEQVFIDIVDRPGERLEDVIRRMTEFLGIAATSLSDVPRENEARVPFNRLLNSALYYSGAKAAISQLIPQGVKGTAKEAYYRPDSIRMSVERRAFIAPKFEASNRQLARLTGLNLDHWRAER